LVCFCSEIEEACGGRQQAGPTDAASLRTPETPEHLTLVIVSEKLVRKCRVIWRDGKKMGVAFI
jgi:hypothetical protein